MEEKKINQTHYGSGDNVAGDKHEHHHHQVPHKIPKVLTKQVGLANDIDFVGRKEELQKVDELLTQNAMLLLLNGIGGIGKSTLASYYLNEHKEAYDYYGFIQVDSDIKLSLVTALSTSLNLESEKIDDLFNEAMNKLQNLEGKKLLIIDDVKEMDNQLDEMNTLMTLKNSGFNILFTSREVKEYIPQYFLDIMNIVDARELFRKHFPTDEIAKVDKILTYLDYHTLFIEITAKTLTKRKNTLSLDTLIEKFENGEFTIVKRNKSESFNKFLKNFSYDSDIFTQKKTLLFLKRLSVLPSIEISFENLYKFLVCDDKEKLEDFLIKLVDNGWLIESNNSYKFHQILKEYIYSFYLPIFHEIESIIDFISNTITNSDDILVALDVRKFIIFFESLNNLLIKQKTENEKIATFYGNLANIYNYLGEYKKAEPLYKQALATSKKLLGQEHVDVGINYNNLASHYEIMGAYEKAEPLYQQSLIITETLVGQEHLTTASTYNNLGRLYRLIGKYKEAESFMKKSLTIREKLLGEEHPDTTKSYNSLAVLYHLMGVYLKAETFYLKDLKIMEKLWGKVHPDTATCYNNLGSLYYELGRYEQAETLYQQALKTRKKLFGKEHPDIAISYNSLAELYHLKGEYENAEIFYQKALEIMEKVFGEGHLNTATVYDNLASLYESIGIYEKAKVFYQKALSITERLVGKEHLDTATSYNNFGSFYHEMGMYEEAELFYQQALEIREKLLGLEHRDTATSYSSLAQIYHSKQEYERAEPFYQQALVIIENLLGKEHLDTATIYDGLGGLYSEMEMYNHVKPLYQQALIIKEKLLGKEHPDTAISYNNLASLYYSIEKYEEALDFHHKALAIRKKVFGESHLDTAQSYFWLGVLYLEDKDYKKAYSYIKKSKRIYEDMLPLDHPRLKNIEEWLKDVKEAYNLNKNNTI